MGKAKNKSFGKPKTHSYIQKKKKQLLLKARNTWFTSNTQNAGFIGKGKNKSFGKPKTLSFIQKGRMVNKGNLNRGGIKTNQRQGNVTNNRSAGAGIQLSRRSLDNVENIPSENDKLDNSFPNDT